MADIFVERVLASFLALVVLELADRVLGDDVAGSVISGDSLMESASWENVLLSDIRDNSFRAASHSSHLFWRF